MEDKQLNYRRASDKRSKKRKFHGNKFTNKNDAASSSTLNVSASERKLGVVKEHCETDDDDDFKGYRIFDIKLMFSSLEKYLCCKTCGGNVVLNEETVLRLSSKIEDID